MKIPFILSYPFLVQEIYFFRMNMFSHMVAWILLFRFAIVVAQVLNHAKRTTSGTAVVPTELTHILVATDADIPILVATDADTIFGTSALPAELIFFVIGLVQNEPILVFKIGFPCLTSTFPFLAILHAQSYFHVGHNWLMLTEEYPRTSAVLCVCVECFICVYIHTSVRIYNLQCYLQRFAIIHTDMLVYDPH